MDTVVSSGGGSKRSRQDESSPIPLAFEIVARRKRVVRREGRSQDETAPFPLEFEVIARRAPQSQEETSPFLLEFMAVLPNGEPAFVRTARPPRTCTRRSSPRRLPILKWHGADASTELRQYAARIAAGECLPPFRGPILESGEFPQLRRGGVQAAHAAPRAMSRADDSKAFTKLALAFVVMSALVVASAVVGSDEQLRGVGQAISGWLTGNDDAQRR